MQPGQEYAILDTSMTIRAFPLSHAGTPSTAFLIQAAGFYVLYCGDTGPDAVEQRVTFALSFEARQARHTSFSILPSAYAMMELHKHTQA
jgi:cAMP phosphodiesterase